MGGLLRPHVTNSFDRHRNCKCEFIAISAGSAVVPEDYSDWGLSFKEFCYIKNGKGEVVEFYNVLWIQRKGDIAVPSWHWRHPEGDVGTASHGSC